VEHSSGMPPAAFLFLAFIVMAVGLALALRKKDGQ
jgi:hypothetical protein